MNITFYKIIDDNDPRIWYIWGHRDDGMEKCFTTNYGPTDWGSYWEWYMPEDKDVLSVTTQWLGRTIIEIPHDDAFLEIV